MRYGLKPRYKHRIEDQTMYYGQEDSSTDFVGMEQRLWPNHEVDPHCEPMYDWQSTFYPVCNEVHGWSLQQELVDERMGILSSKGFWRDAWIQSEALNITTNTTTKIRPARVKSQSFVWRTFK